jgi:hypothetical protein
VRDFQQKLVRPVAAGLETIVTESLKVPAHVWRSSPGSILISAEIEEGSNLLWGDKDGFSFRGEQEALKTAIAGARLIAYPGVGHALHWEEPLGAAADITAFVENLTPVMPRASRFA